MDDGATHRPAAREPQDAEPPVPDVADDRGSSRDSTRRGLVIGGVLGAVLVAVGVIVGIAWLGGGDGDGDASSTTSAAPPATVPPTTGAPPATTVAASTSTPPPTTVPVDASQLVGVAVRFGSFDTLLTEEETEAALARIAGSGDVVVASPDAPVQLCATLPISSGLGVSARWERDGEPLRDQLVDLRPPADGDCLVEPAGLAVGSYQVLFVAADGTETPVVTFTVGVDQTTQAFLNDTGVDLCSIEMAPSTTGFFEPFVAAGSAVFVPVDGSATVPLAATEHEVRGVPCDGEPLASFFFVPGEIEVRLSDGAPVGLPAVSDDVLTDAFGVIGSSEQPLDDGERAALAETLLAPDALLVVASEAPSRLLCAAYRLPGGFDGFVVWEYNGVELIRQPVSSIDGTVTDCIPPGDDTHGLGAYQAFLDRDGVASGVATFTLGRAQTALSFVNDTGSEICQVGFSPDPTNFYTFYSFLGSDAFGDALAVGESFQITAPRIENDIVAIGCDERVVSENFGIAPTDQIVSLADGA